MACPICQSDDFFIKHPADEFEIYEFKYQDGRIEYEDDEAPDEVSKLSKDPEIFCQRCAWHGKISNVK